MCGLILRDPALRASEVHPQLWGPELGPRQKSLQHLNDRAFWANGQCEAQRTGSAIFVPISLQITRAPSKQSLSKLFRSSAAGPVGNGRVLLLLLVAQAAQAGRRVLHSGPQPATTVGGGQGVCCCSSQTVVVVALFSSYSSGFPRRDGTGVCTPPPLLPSLMRSSAAAGGVADYATRRERVLWGAWLSEGRVF
jgi:hypothetical protein